MTHINAQSFKQTLKKHLYTGIKAEANMSNYCISDIDNAESNLKVGATFGTFVGYRIGKHFSIQEDILFQYSTSSIKQDDLEGTMKQWSAEVIFYAMGNWELSNNSKIHFGVGPYSSYGLSAKYKTGSESYNLYKKIYDDKKPFNRSIFGFAITSGYEFKCGLQFNATYKLGITDALDATKDTGTMLPNTFCIGIGYKF
jgi:hypothetical protein